jgi:cytochrome c peroxidase
VAQTNALDGELQALLAAASQGRGPAFFTMPKSHQLDRIPQDPKNPLTPQKVRLGQLLFHETAMGIMNLRPEGYETYSCASCHHAQGGFMANLPQGVAEGGSGFGSRGEGRTFQPQYDPELHAPDCQPIRTPTAMNAAYQELMLWNGQFGGVGDNLGTEEKWTPGTPLGSNALGMHGLETQAHGGLQAHRMLAIETSRVSTLPKYSGLFRAAFDGEVNRLNAALAIAAYERTLLSNEAPFQKWLAGNENAMNAQQKRGAILFFGEAGCVSCHTGPALNSMTFHALGMTDLDGAYDPARVNLDPFGGTVPDATRKGRGGFTGLPEDDYKFKTPQLYNLGDSPFLGHGASFATVRQVIEYKNAGVPQNSMVPLARMSPLFTPLGLTPEEVDDLVAFVSTALYDSRLMRYVPQRLPSGNCFPVNDPQAQEELDCTAPRRSLTGVSAKR